MKLGFIDEPELEFGAGGRHVDIRFGLMNWGPLDRDPNEGPPVVRLGVVGPRDLVDQFRRWADALAEGIPAKTSDLSDLFVLYPELDDARSWPPRVEIAEHAVFELSGAEVAGLSEVRPPSQAVSDAVDAYADRVTDVATAGGVDVAVCLVPWVLERLRTGVPAPASEGQVRIDFHDALKAKAIGAGIPIQLVLPSALGLGTAGASEAATGRQTQDPATIAWNLVTALYYKSGGRPWRIPRESSDFAVCYLGIGFFKQADGEVGTSLAQVFDERGEGVIVRGGAAAMSAGGRSPHMSLATTFELAERALSTYRRTHGNAPARVVAHKSSRWTEDELSGLVQATGAHRIESIDALSLDESYARPRLFPDGDYPPVRGTVWEMDDDRFALYTRGTVPFYRTYPGLYVPRSIVVRCDHLDSSLNAAAREMLQLTKMNWNSTQFDRSLPLTIAAARTVGNVMRFGPPLEREYRFSAFI